MKALIGLIYVFYCIDMTFAQPLERPKAIQLIQGEKEIPLSLVPDPLIIDKRNKLHYPWDPENTYRESYSVAFKSCFIDGQYSEKMSTILSPTAPSSYTQMNSYCCLEGSVDVTGGSKQKSIPKFGSLKRNMDGPLKIETNHARWVTEQEEHGPYYIFGKERTYLIAANNINTKTDKERDDDHVEVIAIYCSPGLLSRKDFSLKNMQHQFGDYFKVSGKVSDSEIVNAEVNNSDRSIKKNETQGMPESDEKDIHVNTNQQ